MRQIAVLRMLLDRRKLIYELVIRELRDRHAGQLLGTIWAFGHPRLVMGTSIN